MPRKRTPVEWIDSCFGIKAIAGVDEAGRGALAGPVVAAAVILPSDFNEPELRESKQLTPSQRIKLQEQIQEHAIAWSADFLLPQYIDSMNILRASLEAMRRAVEKLAEKPELVVVDGKFLIPQLDFPQQAIVRADQKVRAVAAASVLAKTYRDRIMLQLHEEYPLYGWASNKGYPTRFHRQSIRDHGPSPHHRLSFRLV